MYPIKLPKYAIPKKLEDLIYLYNLQSKTIQQKTYEHIKCYFFEHLYGVNGSIDSAIRTGLAQRFHDGFSIKKIYSLNYAIFFVVLQKDSETITDSIICHDTINYKTIYVGYHINCDCPACKFIKGFPKEMDLEDLMKALEDTEKEFEEWFKSEENDPRRAIKYAHFRTLVSKINTNLTTTEKKIINLLRCITNYLLDQEQKNTSTSI